MAIKAAPWESVGQSLYVILGIAPSATSAEIKSAWRKVAVLHHPDKGGDPNKFSDAQIAYETLSNPLLRREYDDHLKEQEPTPPKYGGYQPYRAHKPTQQNATPHSTYPPFATTPRTTTNSTAPSSSATAPPPRDTTAPPWVHAAQNTEYTNKINKVKKAIKASIGFVGVFVLVWFAHTLWSFGLVTILLHLTTISAGTILHSSPPSDTASTILTLVTATLLGVVFAVAIWYRTHVLTNRILFIYSSTIVFMTWGVLTVGAQTLNVSAWQGAVMFLLAAVVACVTYWYNTTTKEARKKIFHLKLTRPKKSGEYT